MLLKLLRITKSKNPDKKLDATFEKDNGRTKTISFGANGYEDYTTHHDEDRKNRYLNRHKRHEDWNNPMTAGSLSKNILWNKPTIKASIKDFKQKFNL
jgi:hypothetical protein